MGFLQKIEVKKLGVKAEASRDSLGSYYQKMKAWALKNQKNWEEHMAQIAKKPEKTENFSEPDLTPLFLKATGIHPNDAAKITDRRQQEEILDKHLAFLKKQYPDK